MSRPHDRLTEALFLSAVLPPDESASNEKEEKYVSDTEKERSGGTGASELTGNTGVVLNKPNICGEHRRAQNLPLINKAELMLYITAVIAEPTDLSEYFIMQQ